MSEWQGWIGFRDERKLHFLDAGYLSAGNGIDQAFVLYAYRQLTELTKLSEIEFPQGQAQVG
jgi:hypothetical protein